jgi:hypothetical protein
LRTAGTDTATAIKVAGELVAHEAEASAAVSGLSPAESSQLIMSLLRALSKAHTH